MLRTRCYSLALCARDVWHLWEATTNSTTTATSEEIIIQPFYFTVSHVYMTQGINYSFFIIEIHLPCALWTAWPALLQDLQYSLSLASCPMSWEFTSQQWQNQVSCNATPRPVVYLSSRDKTKSCETDRFYNIMYFYRSWPGFHCLSSSSSHDAFTSNVGCLLLHYADLPWTG